MQIISFCMFTSPLLPNLLRLTLLPLLPLPQACLFQLTFKKIVIVTTLIRFNGKKLREILALIPNYCESTCPKYDGIDYSSSFKLLKTRCLFRSTFFPVLQASLRLRETALTVFEVVLGVSVGFVPFMEKRSYQPFGCSSALN